MYKIFTFWLVKAPLGVLKVLLCIYSVFGFFFRVNLAYFAYDYLVTLELCLSLSLK